MKLEAEIWAEMRGSLSSLGRGRGWKCTKDIAIYSCSVRCNL